MRYFSDSGILTETIGHFPDDLLHTCSPDHVEAVVFQTKWLGNLGPVILHSCKMIFHQIVHFKRARLGLPTIYFVFMYVMHVSSTAGIVKYLLKKPKGRWKIFIVGT